MSNIRAAILLPGPARVAEYFGENLGNRFLGQQFLDLIARKIETLGVEFLVAGADVELADPAQLRHAGEGGPFRPGETPDWRSACIIS